MEPDPQYPPVSPFSANVGGVESSGNVTATNPLFPTSEGGPMGAHQFVASTWKSFARARPDLFGGMNEDQILAARNNPRLSAMGTDWYANQNGPILAKAGIVPTAANLGIAHALGPAGAISVLKSDDNTPVIRALKSDVPDVVLKRNPDFADLTVRELKEKYAHFDADKVTPEVPDMQDMPKTQTTQVAPMTPFYPMAGGDNALSLLSRLGLPNQLLTSAPPPLGNMNDNVMQALARAGQVGRGAAPDPRDVLLPGPQQGAPSGGHAVLQLFDGGGCRSPGSFLHGLFSLSGGDPAQAMAMLTHAAMLTGAGGASGGPGGTLPPIGGGPQPSYGAPPGGDQPVYQPPPRIFEGIDEPARPPGISIDRR